MDPSGFSHVLSARGLDVLDDALDQARRQMAKDPTDENIQHFSDLEQQFRENGGYEAESVMGRLAAGVGLPEDVLLDDIETLSGGQRRRVDLVRILFQAPDVMVLDEPTNHLDLGAKRWLMDELATFRGALLVVSHDLQLLDRSITKVFHLDDGRLHEYKGTYSSYRAQLAADQDRRERAAELEGREIKRLSTLADTMRGQTDSAGPRRQVPRPPGRAARGPAHRGLCPRAQEHLPPTDASTLGGGAAGRRPSRCPLWRRRRPRRRRLHHGAR